MEPVNDKQEFIVPPGMNSPLVSESLAFKLHVPEPKRKYIEIGDLNAWHRFWFRFLLNITIVEE